MALYNQTIKTATTSSPYFTSETIDLACYNCANEIGNPLVFSSQCDICKTLTIEEITTYHYFDTLFLFLLPITIAIVVGFFIKKK